MTADSYATDSCFHSPISRAVRGLRARLVATIAGSTAWISFTLLYLGFWAHGFSLVQNVIVVITSLVLLFGTIVALWVSFGLSFVRRWTDW
jgi:hypothetical protein